MTSVFSCNFYEVNWVELSASLYMKIYQKPKFFELGFLAWRVAEF